ncbi:SDR family NAD(P)-dependent oxidoreductase [Brucella gallinifaecis]|uniref:SDR family NAD(P)-dependent oxidoreductase n=1 Tax=Brucella gallinifaecis TaxID=215590 RepID=A0A502BK61_9HYPH|nr:SDR family NAD(P)-dependent oxidoreductase [Brucella gallinifaecis]TPF74061.1 SDR family NAD(P)-dependent oxidoreductase [Brucella gallinifaecis]
MQQKRTILISGANRGIGAATARAFLAAGWNVSLGMRTPQMPDWADAASTQIEAYDATDPAMAKRWANAAVERFGRIDAVVANAGVMVRKSVIEATDEEFDTLMDVNVNGPRLLVKACWDELVKTGSGRVVIVASLSAKRVKSAISGSYSVSKFAALGLSHAIRHAGFEKGVRSTAICPGFVATDMGTPLASSSDVLTRPEDVASSILHIVSLPNSASVSEFWVNSLLDDSY